MTITETLAPSCSAISPLCQRLARPALPPRRIAARSAATLRTRRRRQIPTRALAHDAELEIASFRDAVASLRPVPLRLQEDGFRPTNFIVRVTLPKRPDAWTHYRKVGRVAPGDPKVCSRCRARRQWNRQGFADRHQQRRANGHPARHVEEARGQRVSAEVARALSMHWLGHSAHRRHPIDGESTACAAQGHWRNVWRKWADGRPASPRTCSTSARRPAPVSPSPEQRSGDGGPRSVSTTDADGRARDYSETAPPTPATTG